jgi:hypothetical protein
MFFLFFLIRRKQKGYPLQRSLSCFLNSCRYSETRFLFFLSIVNFQNSLRFASFKTFHTSGAGIRIPDSRMFVKKEIDFANHLLRTCFDAFPAGGALAHI